MRICAPTVVLRMEGRLRKASGARGKDLRLGGRSLTKPGEPGWGSQESLSSPGLSLQALVNNYFGHRELELQVGEGDFPFLDPIFPFLGLPSPSFTRISTHTFLGWKSREWRETGQKRGEEGGRLE